MSVCQRYQDATDRYGRHASPICQHALRVRLLPQPVEPLHRVHDPEVADRQHVRPVQPEHQEHLGGPAAEALHRRQPFDHHLVGQRVELVELQAPVGDARAQVAQIADFLTAQADAAQRRIVDASMAAASGIRPSGNSATNRPKIVAAAFVESCWLTIAPTRAR